MINAHKVSKVFQHQGSQKLILDTISLEIPIASWTLITGVSGSGKSTLLSLLGGLDSPTSGAVYWNGKDLRTFSKKEYEEFLNKQCGYLFQYPYLIPEFTVLENCTIKGLCIGMPKKELVEQGMQLLHLVALEGKAKQTPEKLSGGEQQRVALIRALFHQPKILFADEPFSHLDTRNAELVLELLTTYQQKHNLSIILSSHPHEILFQNNHIFSRHFELTEGQLFIKQ